MRRRPDSTRELDRREGEWWVKFGELEERYCWVLPDRFQPPARRRYLDHVVGLLAGHEVVVDYGCGTGWLCLQLARRLGARVIGVDRFASQIERARANAARAGLANAEFQVADSVADLPAADAYVFHGVLHHLSQFEIDALMAAVAVRGRGAAELIVVEPACYPGSPTTPGQARLFAEADRLFAWRNTAERLTFSKPVAAEADLRARLETRWEGELPYGPSPKEKPFEGDELAAYLGQRFHVLEERPVQCLNLSQRLSSELALAELSMPRLVAMFGPSLIRRMAAIERRLLAASPLPDRSWYMTLLHCRGS